MSYIYDWSTTPASNATADPSIDMAEFMAPDKVNDGIRQIMARIAEWRKDLGGTITTAGTGNAYTATINSTLGATYPDGLTVWLTVDRNNGGSSTLALNGNAAVPIRAKSAAAIPANALLAGSMYAFRYRAATNEFIVTGSNAGFQELAPSLLSASVFGLRVGDPMISFNPTPNPGFIRLTETTQAVLKASYPALDAWASALGYPWGSASTTFNLPPAAGYALRIAGTTNAIDPSGPRSLGSTQADGIRDHVHTGTTSSDGAHTHDYTRYGSVYPGDNTDIANTWAGFGTGTTTPAGAHSHTFTTSATTGAAAETRMKNVGVALDILASPALVANGLIGSVGYSYRFSSSTSGTDPGGGRIRLSGVTPVATAELYVSETDDLGSDLSAALASWVSGTSTIKGRLRLVKVGTPAVFAEFDITTRTDNGSWNTFAVTFRASSGTMADNDAVHVTFIAKGDKGDAGGAAGVSSVNSRSGDVTLDKSDVGLGNVDNTTDAAKPISTAAQTALNARVQYVADRTALAALPAAAGRSAFLMESGREGQFVCVAGSTPSDAQQGLNVASSTAGFYWSRQFSGRIHASWFGASSALSDNTAAVQAAFDLAQSSATAKEVELPVGTLIVLTALVLRPGVSVYGKGWYRTQIDFRGTYAAFYTTEALFYETIAGFSVTHANNANAGVAIFDFAFGFTRGKFDVECIGKPGCTNVGIRARAKTAAGANTPNYGTEWKFRIASSGAEISGIGLWLEGAASPLCESNAHVIIPGSIVDGFSICISQYGNGNKYDGLTVNGPASDCVFYFEGASSVQNMVENGYFDAAITGKIAKFSAGSMGQFVCWFSNNLGVNTNSQFSDVSTGGNSAKWAVNNVEAIPAVGAIPYVSTPNTASPRFATVTAVASGQVLISQGTATAPAWSASPTLTSVIAPLYVGGSTATSVATIQSTSGVGTTDRIALKTGNNGSLEPASVTQNGLGIFQTSPQAYLDLLHTGGARPALKVTVPNGAPFIGHFVRTDIAKNIYWYIDGAGNLQFYDSAGSLVMFQISQNGINAAPGFRATSSLGFATGAGGTVTQLTSKSTGVTLNKACGQITMNNASLAAGAVVSFTLTNSMIAATDVVTASIASGATAGAYTVTVDAVAAGSCRVSLRNVSGGALAEAVVINFAELNAVTA